MKCPIDQTLLTEKEYERAVMVDHCTNCSGMWLDQWELQAIQANKGNYYKDELQKLPNLVNQSYLHAIEKNRPLINCPKCEDNGKEVQMERREHGYCSQIMVDVCHDCQGIWLDKGEVQALEIFFERSHLENDEIKSGFLSNLWSMFIK